MGKFIGIDLGTTYSCVAWIDDNKSPEIIRNMEGKTTTPSVVLFDGSNTLVGEEAKKVSVTEPQKTEQYIKRHMGERDYFFTDPLGEKFTPEAVSALILKKLVEDTRRCLGDKIEGAVITVPAYFTDAQRKATMDAGEIAGLKVLDIINEPTAAALAYSFSGRAADNEKTILVYDLGGGTFDVTVLDISGDIPVVLGTYGDKYLGGYDFDQEIVQSVCKNAQDQGASFDNDPEAWQELMLRVEEAKVTLSSRNETQFVIYPNGKRIRYSLTRSDFEEMIDPLLNRSFASVDTALDKAGLQYSDLDKILLVGGSTKIPYVSQIIEEISGIRPSKDINPDEAVAIGAAYLARNYGDRIEDEILHTSSFGEAKEEEPQVPTTPMFRDVTSYGIGIVTINDNDELENSIIVPGNTPVPTEVTNVYCTIYPYQDVLEIQITQGDDTDLRFVQVIGTASIPVVPRKELVDIGVTVVCGENSLVHVQVFDLDRNEDLGEINIDRISNLTREEIDIAKKRISAFDISGD